MERRASYVRSAHELKRVRPCAQVAHPAPQLVSTESCNAFFAAGAMAAHAVLEGRPWLDWGPGGRARKETPG